MSISIDLCTNNSDKKRLDKSLKVIKTVNGDLRDDMSIINPIILIECSDAEISQVNYLKIPSFNRNYFVNDITSIRKNLWEIKCHVDVLSSFSESLKKCTAIIKRQENSWNLFLNDDSFRCYQDPHVITRQFPSGFNSANPSYVLLVAGRPVDGWFDDSNTES